MTAAFSAVHKAALARKVDNRTAAIIVATRRIEESMTLRGRV